MKQLKLFLIIFCINCFGNSAYSQNDSIVAVTELQRMNNTFGYRIKMNITKEGRIVSLPDEEIQLSLSELKNISSITRKDIRLYIVRFIVAHEFAHQIQYYRYTRESRFMNNDLISKTLIETQADIMAGFIFFVLSPEILMYMGSHPQLVDDVLKELFIVTHAMGIRENSLGSHPSKRDRMLAVRLGLMHGFGFVSDQWVKSDIPRAIQNGVTLELFQKQMENHFRFIDLKSGEDYISWSYRQAKKIVNYDRTIATSIVLLTPLDDRITWHTDITSPYVDYNLTYKNIGTKSIYIEMEVYVALVKKEETSSPEVYRKINVNHYEFTLLPGESKVVEGKLLWLKNESDILGDFELGDHEMPRIVYPGLSSDDGIYSCSYINDLSSQVYQEKIKYLNLMNSNKAVDFRSFLNTILNLYNLNYQDAIIGVGEVNERYPDEIIYISSLQFGNETLTLVSVDSLKKITTIDLSFPNFYPDANLMFNKFDEIKRQLNSELEGSKVEEEQVGDNLWVNYLNPEYDIILMAIKNDETKDFYIKLIILFD